MTEHKSMRGIVGNCQHLSVGYSLQNCYFSATSWGMGMGSIFLAALFLVGFAWKMVVSATTFALLAYAIARIWWSAETKLPRGIGWGVWFAILAYHLFPIAFVKAFSVTGTYLLAAAISGGVVLVLGGLCVLMARTDRRSLRAIAFLSTLFIIGLIGFTPFGASPRREAVAASTDEAVYRTSAAMYAAAQQGDLLQLGDLVSRGADVNASFLGLSPLYGAVIERQFGAAAFLLDIGADVNSASGPAQRRPLHQAVLNGDIRMIKLLLSRGANVAATTTHGRTPLDYAVSPPAPLTKPANGEEIAAILRAAGAK